VTWHVAAVLGCAVVVGGMRRLAWMAVAVRDGERRRRGRTWIP
jgi:hypothetical protein